MRIVPALLLLAGVAVAQEYGKPDRGQPGDAMIQASLHAGSVATHARFATDLVDLETWKRNRPRYRQEYFHMLGLWPLPGRTPLGATVTGVFRGDGFVVEKLHYQSRPRLYVTGNLYRPARAAGREPLPAVLYVCGHAGRGRNGNKTAYQSQGIWFARHGYVCLVVDTLQLGEIAAIHHGTYREERWWWHSRGYTSAGVECWNGVRGIDYLVSRDDVDPERIAVTGISGGGAATFWVSAADERVTVAVAVSGMADLPSYISNRVINGHCDCMFLHNTFGWPWARIASLVAPRPQLFVNSDNDRIFPMDANERVINRLERLYSLYGAGDRVDSLVSIGGHAYRRDIRRGVFRFINMYLKDDPREVSDSEVDLVRRVGDEWRHPIPPEQLRVFPTDTDIPTDELNTTIDEHFVPMASVEVPVAAEFEEWKRRLLAELRRLPFRYLPDRVPPATSVPTTAGVLETESGITVRLSSIQPVDSTAPDARHLVVIANPDGSHNGFVRNLGESGARLHVLETRGVGHTRWTRRNPPNHVERAHVLLGRTVDTGRVWDAIAVVRHLREKHGRIPVHLAGTGRGAVMAIYAALLEPEVAGVELQGVPASHMDARAAQFLDVLRICDIPDALGMLAPRPVVLHDDNGAALQKSRRIYAAAGATSRFERR